MLELKFGLFFYLYTSNCDNFMFCFIINSITITHVVCSSFCKDLLKFIRLPKISLLNDHGLDSIHWFSPATFLPCPLSRHIYYPSATTGLRYFSIRDSEI